MIAKERQNQIIDLLKTRKIVNAQELAAQYGVSVVTIRRDLDHLVECGLAERIYGGATWKQTQPAADAHKPVYTGRADLQQAEKRAIARKAAELVQDGETIFLDRGTTTAELARLLKHKKRLTVVTCSLAVMNELYDCEHIMVYSVGGLLRGSEASLTGNIATSVLKNFYLNRAFIGAAGITLDGGMMEYYYDTVELRQLVMERSQQVVLLADSSKFGVRSFAVVDRLDAVDVIVTDTGLPASYAEQIGQMDVELVLTEK